ARREWRLPLMKKAEAARLEESAIEADSLAGADRNVSPGLHRKGRQAEAVEVRILTIAGRYQPLCEFFPPPEGRQVVRRFPLGNEAGDESHGAKLRLLEAIHTAAGWNLSGSQPFEVQPL